MSVAIFWNNKKILDCQNFFFRELYYAILNITDQKKINFNKELSKLIDRLEIAGNGWGFNLADYITSKENLLIFLNLIRSSVDMLYENNPNLLPDYKKTYEEFYQELINIQQLL